MTENANDWWGLDDIDAANLRAARGDTMTAGRFNELYPVGTPVNAYPAARPEDDKDCARIATRTRTPAWVLSGHTPVVMVEGHGACIALTHVDPR